MKSLQIRPSDDGNRILVRSPEVAGIPMLPYFSVGSLGASLKRELDTLCNIYQVGHKWSRSEIDKCYSIRDNGYEAWFDRKTGKCKVIRKCHGV